MQDDASRQLGGSSVRIPPSGAAMPKASSIVRRVAAVLLAAAFGAAHAADIVVLTGSGTSSLNSPLAAAGFNVINGTLAPGQIAGRLTADTIGVDIWNDGSLGNTGSAANPALAFNAADQAALLAFAATHSNIIMDGLSWRSNGNVDERNFSSNEATLLAGAGGGIVLGADDASGALIVQHVNQVASWLDYSPWSGTYSTQPANQVFGGTFFTTPNPVDPTNVVGTTTYSEVPNGLQPNGSFLATALFGFDSLPLPGFGPSPPLGSATFNGMAYSSVNHIVTTNIAGAGIDPIPTPVPEPETYALLIAGLGVLGAAVRRRNASRRG
jgi:hypothetical protein